MIKKDGYFCTELTAPHYQNEVTFSLVNIWSIPLSVNSLRCPVIFPGWNTSSNMTTKLEVGLHTTLIPSKVGYTFINIMLFSDSTLSPTGCHFLKCCRGQTGQTMALRVVCQCPTAGFLWLLEKCAHHIKSNWNPRSLLLLVARHVQPADPSETVFNIQRQKKKNKP